MNFRLHNGLLRSLRGHALGHVLEPVLGVTIEPHVIRVAYLVKNKNTVELRALVSEPLSIGDDLRENDSALDEHLALRLRHIWNKLNIRRTGVAIAIAQRYVVKQTLQIDPHTPESDLEIALLAHAEKILPYAVSDIAVDYRLNPQTPNVATVAICHKQQIERLDSIAKKAALSLLAVEDDVSASARGKEMRTRGYRGQMINVSHQVDRKTWTEEGADYDVSCGLLIGRGFNLMPWRERLSQHKNKVFLATALLFAAIAQIPVWWHHGYTATKYQHGLNTHDKLAAHLAALDTRINRERASLQSYQTRARQHTIISSWEGANQWIKQILERVPTTIPTGLRLEHLQLAKPLSVVRGQTTRLRDVSEFSTRINQIPLVQKTELAELRANKDTSGHQFSVHIWISDPGP